MNLLFFKVKDRGLTIGEDVLGIIAVSIVKALRYLQETLHVIHRDVKPSNVLLNKEGMCVLEEFLNIFFCLLGDECKLCSRYFFIVFFTPLLV